MEEAPQADGWVSTGDNGHKLEFQVTQIADRRGVRVVVDLVHDPIMSVLARASIPNVGGSSYCRSIQQFFNPTFARLNRAKDKRGVRSA